MIDVNKYGGYVFYYIFNKGKLILIGWAYITRDCYSLLPGLVCKGKIKNKMFKKNVKGMQQNIKAGVLATRNPDKYTHFFSGVNIKIHPGGRKFFFLLIFYTSLCFLGRLHSRLYVVFILYFAFSEK